MHSIYNLLMSSILLWKNVSIRSFHTLKYSRIIIILATIRLLNLNANLFSYSSTGGANNRTSYHWQSSSLFWFKSRPYFSRFWLQSRRTGNERSKVLFIKFKSEKSQSRNYTCSSGIYMTTISPQFILLLFGKWYSIHQNNIKAIKMSWCRVYK